MNWHPWIASILSLVGIGTLALAALEFFRSKATSDWHFAEATVIESKVEVVHDDGKFYQARISYRYIVDGQVYFGEGLRGELASWSWAWPARRAAGKYPTGRKVLAYYTPAQPGKSVLEPGLSAGRVIGLTGVGLVILATAWNQLNA